MPVLALLVALAVVSFEQFMQSYFGVLGVVGFLLLTIGLKAKHVGCSCAGALVLFTLLLQT